MSLPVCKFFTTNKSCRLGRHCRYLHTYSESPPIYKHNVTPGDQYGNSVNKKNSSLFQYKPVARSEETPDNEESVSSVSDQFSSEKTSGHRYISSPSEGPADPTNPPAPHSDNRKLCFDFSRNGECKYGDKCRFLHAAENKPQRQHERRRGRKRNQICHFFKEGRCDRGNQCKFRHPTEILNNGTKHRDDGKSSSKRRNTNVRRNRKSKVRNGGARGQRKLVFTVAEAEAEGVGKLRQAEIAAIRHRFTEEEMTIEEDSESEFTTLVKFIPSDPDWPFDINLFEIVISIPATYPIEMLKINMPKEQDLPETIRRYTEITIVEWLEEKLKTLESDGQVELVFIPFFEWFDSVIEEVTMEAMKQLKRELVARAAGIEIFSPRQLQEKLRLSSSDDQSDVSSEDSHSLDYSSDSDVTDSEDSDGDVTSDLDPQHKGTEVTLRNLQLKDNASDLLFHRLKVVIQCERCRDHSDVTLHQARTVSTQCGRCSQVQSAHFRPALLHQFSSVLGYLDLDGCHAFDLVLQDCQAMVSCMGCSKQTRLEGLVTGQRVDGWCQACHAKYTLSADCVKLTQLAPSVVHTASSKTIEVAPTKAKKPPKDPAIKEGTPLPETGTCRHYRHSYRWLRFPCCGHAYPCDVCHDKREDHQHDFANRMICGHCSKEQHFSAIRPCQACDSHMTKVRSAHWEGGQGCRDKAAMSRHDTHKYKNQSKTTSNHKKNMHNKGKRSTKLRHS